jgi:hypothetical protein
VSEEPEEVSFIPRVLGLTHGISIFEESQDPVVVVSLLLPNDVDVENLVYRTSDGMAMVLPVAFTPSDLQMFVPEMIESVIRARTLTELLTTWPERRDEIIANVHFRWTGEVPPSEDDDDG